MKNTIFFITSILLFSCTNQNKKADAFGNFEAIEIIVSAEQNGKLIWANITEGDNLEEGTITAITDTTIPAKQVEQTIAKLEAVQAQLTTTQIQGKIHEEQYNNLLREKNRILRLYNDSAATQKQLDDITGNLKILELQVSLSHSQISSLLNEINAQKKQLDIFKYQLKKCYITNPIKGIILEKYIENHELVTIGKPLYKIANINDLILRAYISEPQLSAIKIGDPVTVSIDNNKKLKSFQGKIIWISKQAEFTPKIIQTKEERINMVYAVKIQVKNDGSIKIGMPGEVKFNTAN